MHARTALWMAYFLAPAVTTGIVIEGALRLLKPRWLQRRTLRDHLVVVGLGRLGETFLEGLFAVKSQTRVLLVDTTNERLAATADKHGVPYLVGDIRNVATFRELALNRARGVVLLTRDDLVNLEAAWEILELRPNLPVVAHIADIHMKRELDTLMGDTVGQRVRPFNSHHVAAVGLYDRHLAPRFRETAGLDMVVIAGFGRFGQTILEHLRKEAGSDVERVVIVDRAARALVATFDEQTEASAFAIDVIDGDVADAGVWDQVATLAQASDEAPAIILGTDLDTLNLRTAMMLRKRNDDAEIFVRCFHESHFSSQIASRYRVHVMGLGTMMQEALAEQQKLWFS
jgi:Trk K+ transport system NAD-binding subunit